MKFYIRYILAWCIFTLFAGYTVAQTLAEDTSLAQQGDAQAQYRLATRYAFGQEVPLDRNQAAYWYLQAAKQGVSEAQYQLAILYETGDGVLADQTQAIIWYQQAAKAGYPPAEYRLAVAYERGDFSRQSDRQSAYWYLQAAEHGVQAAQYAIGISYMQGRGVPIDLFRAHFWLTVAALGSEENVRQMAEKYKPIAQTRLSQQQIEQNETRAKAFLEKIKQQNS